MSISEFEVISTFFGSPKQVLRKPMLKLMHDNDYRHDQNVVRVERYNDDGPEVLGQFDKV